MSSNFAYPYFLGAYAENDEIFEKILLEFLRDHVYWRRNFHPEDSPNIPVSAQYDPDFKQKIAEIKRELHALSATLKHSVPTFHPRYIGHMCSEMLLPGLLSELITFLYNPNNVCEDTAPVTIDMELEAGEQLANMFGFNTDPNQIPCAWGHLTSGGTLANFESLWNFRAVKFFPIALQGALEKTNFDIGKVGFKQQPITEYDSWELLNFKIDEIVALESSLWQALSRIEDTQFKAHFQRVLANERMEALGVSEFFSENKELRPPLVLAPITAHYSFEKAIKVMGFGTNQFIKIPMGFKTRMDCQALDKALQTAFEQKKSVLAVIAVLGSTEFGNIDPVHEIVHLREQWRARGLEFYIHVDAAWGGYITSLFRSPDGSFRNLKELACDFKYFPSEPVYSAFAALKEVDSITIDPHKLGYLPYGCGAFVCRNREITRFIRTDAAYVFDVENEAAPLSWRQKSRRLGQYILEGSKPGAPAAAVYVTHKVLPLNAPHFGQLIKQTILNAEYFYDRFQALQDKLSGKATVIIPFEPDTNMVCLVINPGANASLAKMNLFMRKIFSHLKVEPTKPLQTKFFFGSYTSLHKRSLPPQESKRILNALGIDPSTFVEEIKNSNLQANSIFLLRHTLMNPWLCHPVDKQNPIDLYCDYLEKMILEELCSLQRFSVESTPNSTSGTRV